MLAATSLAAVVFRDLFAVVMLFGIYSLLSAAFFVNVDAIDVAMTEAAVGAGITTILMLAALGLTTRYTHRPAHGRFLPLLVVTVTGAVLIYGTLDMPHFADPEGPVHHHVAPRYVELTDDEIGMPNIVTAVLASYRGYDTLGETVVIFTAGLGVLMLLGTTMVRRAEEGDAPRPHTILRSVGDALLPLILLFGLYIQFHGDFGPGGGFQAGVVFAAGFILYGLVYSLPRVQQLMPSELLRSLACIGVLIYGGTGLLTLLGGGVYLDYNVLGKTQVAGQHLGIFLVELGVGMNVAATMLNIFMRFAGRRTRSFEDA